MTRLLVCGSRDWSDRLAIKSAIRDWHPQAIIEGGATGADSLARSIGEELGIPVIEFPADWEKFGKAAGPIRNKRMLVEGKPDMVLAFHPDLPNSKGTRNMVNQALRAGLTVITYKH